MSDVKKVPGGVTQNALRVAQWYLKRPHSTTIVGCVGGDVIGGEMSRFMKGEGVRTEYMVDGGAKTGLCAVLVTGANRSLVTRLEAANHYKYQHLVSQKVWKLVEDSTCFYMSVGLLLLNSFYYSLQ